MQNKIFKYDSMNQLQNMIIREKLENELELREFDTLNSYSTKKYSLYCKNKLVGSFEDERFDSGAIREAYQYFLGFIDCYFIAKELK